MGLFSQPCSFDDIYLENQNQVDSFAINFPNCTKITGDIFIGKVGGSDIVNLFSFSSIKSIEGELHISLNPSLSSLAGLDSIQYISGELQIVDH